MKALVFNTKAKAQAAANRAFTLYKAAIADWLDVDGNIVGVNAATDLPAVRSTRTTAWAIPAQRDDTGEWWIPAPPRGVLAAYKDELQAAGATLQDVADDWYPPSGLGA